MSFFSATKKFNSFNPKEVEDFTFDSFMMDIRALVKGTCYFSMPNITSFSEYNKQAYDALQALHTPLSQEKANEYRALLNEYAAILIDCEPTQLQNDLDFNLYREQANTFLNLLNGHVEALVKHNNEISSQYFSDFILNIDNKMIDKFASEIYEVAKREINISLYPMLSSHLMKLQSFRDLLESDSSDQNLGDMAGYGASAVLFLVNPLIGVASGAAKYFYNKNRDSKEQQRHEAYYRELSCIIQTIQDAMVIKNNVATNTFNLIYDKLEQAFTQLDKQIQIYATNTNSSTKEIYEYLDKEDMDELNVQKWPEEELEFKYYLIREIIANNPSRVKKQLFEGLLVDVEKRLNQLG